MTDKEMEQLIISKVNQLNKSLAKQTKLMLFICGELIKLSKVECKTKRLME